ncbi:MFS general substrate transporter [Penicillium citrinum]|uniref:MFS general substrate transporter n=1 Tax=Penicillium citrinum TaxID=5077 RepID=A0A9W9TTI9_PENCI|nr:MFS general substrate transporter [Penicillium citrinum]KAJ5240861.1 MFS general substrate transporter [Penicillium citrinum]
MKATYSGSKNQHVKKHQRSLGVISTQDYAQKPPDIEFSEIIAKSPLARRVVRRIDMMVIPFICITYLVTYVDKAMQGYSAVFGLKDSLDLHGSEYSWLGEPYYSKKDLLTDSDWP